MHKLKSSSSDIIIAIFIDLLIPNLRNSFSTSPMTIVTETHFYFTHAYNIDFAKSYLAPSKIIGTKRTL